MERKLPTPVCLNFVVCRQIVLDQFTQEYHLLGLMHHVTVLDFPTVAMLSVYVECTAVPGTYALELQLQDLEGNLHWRHPYDGPFVSQDPLLVGIIALPNERIYFPKPGKYDLIFLANGEEMGRRVFWAFLATQPAVPPPESELPGQ
jgi:hypothetical protein